MRKIEKRAEPAVLTEWRAANQADAAGAGVNYGYDLLRQDRDVSTALMDSLLKEQGGLCAYTGRNISSATAHVEHVKAQTHCQRGEDVDFNNMVACWPQPNGPHGHYGAHAKGSWPSSAEAALFVSPLSAGCEDRFVFNSRGEIKGNGSDPAAAETIRRLKLDHDLLTALRRSTIDGVLGRERNLSLKKARTRLRALEEAERSLDQGSRVSLDPYCFVLRQVLGRFIQKVERIREHSRGN